jgi:hypothetical protein
MDWWLFPDELVCESDAGTAEFKTLPKHPITSGVQAFKINDEWY